MPCPYRWGQEERHWRTGVCSYEHTTNGSCPFASPFPSPVESPTPCRLTDRHSCLSLVASICLSPGLDPIRQGCLVDAFPRILQVGLELREGYSVLLLVFRTRRKLLLPGRFDVGEFH